MRKLPEGVQLSCKIHARDPHDNCDGCWNVWFGFTDKEIKVGGDNK